VPNKVILPVILEELYQAGVCRENITILVATGTHRPNFGDELISMLGEEIAGTIRIVNHVCTNLNSVTTLGTSPAGVPVALNSLYVQADLRITVGLIEPHFMAGFSGGRKLVMPGLAALHTVQSWHSPRFLEHPNATNGVVEGNPVHEEAMHIASMVRPHLVLDVTLDEANQITGVFAGDLEESWYAGVEFARTQVKRSTPEKADIVVTTCAGAPLDATYYQAVKGMIGALPVVKRGGDIIIAASCSEGIGSSHFKDLMFGSNDLSELVRQMQSDGWTFVQDQWEVEELARVVSHANVSCVCDGITPADLSRCFARHFSSVEAAVDEAIKKHGPDASIIVIPKGPYVIAEANLN